MPHNVFQVFTKGLFGTRRSNGTEVYKGVHEKVNIPVQYSFHYTDDVTSNLVIYQTDHPVIHQA